jgi:hypothetical protein
LLSYAIVLLAFGIRLYHLGDQGLEFDEAFSVQAAFRSLPDIITLLTTQEPHPPLFYSFLHLWYPVAGTTEFALRFPTVLANVLTVALLVRVADFFDWRGAGLVAATFIAINPYQVWYSQEVRMYTPVACFGLAAILFALRAWRDGRRRDLGLYVGFMLLALATHYYAIFLWGFVGLVVGAAILARVRPAALGFARWCGAQVVVAAIYLPWLAYAYRISIYYIRGATDKVSLNGVVKNSLAFYSLGRSMPDEERATLALGFLALVVVGFLAIRRARRWPGWFQLLFLGGYLFLPMILGYIVSHFRSMYTENYLFVSGPAFYLALGLAVVGLWRLRRPLSWPLGVAALLFLATTQVVSLRNYFTDPRYDKAEVVRAFRYVDARLRPGDAFVLDGLGQTTQFWFYNTVRLNDPAPSIVFPLERPDAWDLMPAALDRFMAGKRGAWLLDYGATDGDVGRVVEDYLARNYYQAFYQPIIFNRVVYYATAPPAPAQKTVLNASCGDAILLQEADVYVDRAPAGDIVPLAAHWQALSQTTRRYVVSWRLRDAAGHVVVQRDSEPASGFAPTDTWAKGAEVVDRYGLLLPAWLPPGDYTPEIVVYDKASGATCQFVSGGKAIPGAAITFPRVSVADAPPSPALADPAPQHPTDVAVGNLRFLGFDLDPGPYEPGQTLSARLYWRVDAAPPANAAVVARLLDARGAVVQQARVALGTPDFPTGRWQPGRFVSGYVDLPIPARLMTGDYRLSFVPDAPGAASELLTDHPTVKVVARQRTFQAPSIPDPRSADFGGVIDLLGYALQPAATTLAPGQQIRLTLYWKASGDVSTSYKVFTHLVGPDGKIYGQMDGIPVGGAAPTTSWVSGEFLTDPYQLAIDPGAPPGTYTLAVGFYDPDTGRRISLADHTGDMLVLTQLKVN